MDGNRKIGVYARFLKASFIPISCNHILNKYFEYFMMRLNLLKSAVIFSCSIPHDNVLGLGAIYERKRIKNVAARDIITLIESTCHEFLNRTDVSMDQRYWAKMRLYIQHTTSAPIKTPLSITQVQCVLDLLIRTFSDKRPRVICELLKNHPRILRKDCDSNIYPVIQLLQNLYPGDWFYEAVERNPSLLLTQGIGFNAYPTRQRNQLTMTDHDETVENFLLKRLMLTKGQIAQLKRNYPKVFILSVHKNARPVVDFLISLCSNPENKDKTLKLIQRVIMTNPNIMSLDVFTNLHPKVNYFKEYCGFNCKDIQSLLSRNPGVLGLSLKDNIEPTVLLLEYILSSSRFDAIYRVREQKTLQDLAKNRRLTDSTRTKLRQCLLRHPQIAGLSLDNIATKTLYFDIIDYLSSQNQHSQDHDSTIQVEGTSLAARVASSIPSTFSLNLKNNIIVTVDSLAKCWGVEEMHNTAKALLQTKDFSAHASNGEMIDFSHMLGEYPAVLSLSLESNILPKLKFYNQTGYIQLDRNGRGNNSLRSRYIATSLSNCLLPRWNYFKLCSGRNGTQRLPLHILAGVSDEKFSQKMGYDLEDYLQYKTVSLPVLKFRSQFDIWMETGKPIDGI